MLDLAIVSGLRLQGMNNPTEQTLTLDMGVEGMTCASCVAGGERAVRKGAGVQDATENLPTETVRVTAAPAGDIDALVRRAVRAAGYTPRDAQAAQPDDASPWTGFGPVATGLLLCVPLLAPMLLEPFGIPWMLPAWAQLLLAAPV